MPAPIKWKSDFDVIPSYPNNAQSQPWVTASPDGRFGVSITYDWGVNDIDYHWLPFFADGTAGTLVNGSSNPNPINERTSSVAYLGLTLANVQVWTMQSALGGGTGIDIYYKIIGGPPNVAASVVHNGAGDQVDPVVAASSAGDFAVAFIDTNVPQNALTVRFYNTAGTFVTEVSRTASAPQSITNTAGDFRDVALTALANNNYVVTWDHIVGGRPEIHGQVYTSLGVAVGSEFVVGNVPGAFGGTGSDVVALPDGRFLVVQIQSGNLITGQFFLSTGIASGSAFGIASNANPATTNKVDAALLKDGRFVVVWQNNVNSGDISGQILFANGTPDGAAFTVNTVTTGAQNHPSVAVLEDGRFVVAWEDQAGALQRDTATIFDPRESGLSTSASSLNDDWIGSAFADVLDMGAGADTVQGGAGADTLSGGAGNDMFVASAALDGSDQIDGAADSDTVDYSALGAGNGITVTLNGGTAATVVIASGNNDTILNIENVTGGAGADSIVGDLLSNKITGGLGDDTLGGGGGNDTLDGGSGSDTASYAGASGAVTVSLTNISGGHSGGTSSGADGIDTLIDIENLTGSAFNDYLNGNSSANILVGGAGSDTVSYASLGSANGINVTLNGAINAILTIAGGVTDTLREIENVTGGAGADTIIGDSADNALIGGFGDDSLAGGGGNDLFTFFHPTDGADTIDGGAGIDTIVYTNLFSGNHIAVTLNGAASVILTVSGQSSDTISNIENVTSGAGADSLVGDNLTNILSGAAGNDTLIGGAGNDELLGNVGVDTAGFSGLRSDYATSKNAGVLFINDLRGGSPDALDQMSGIERFQFAGGVTLAAEAFTPVNFNGDLNSDILWCNSSGQAVNFLMNGTTITGAGSIGGANGSAWRATAVGDLNGDGSSDVIWQDTGGLVVAYLMNGTGIGSAVSVGNMTSAFRVVGSGDLNGDGNSDIVVQNNSGLAVGLLMNGGTIIGSGTIGAANGAAWSVAALGDLNADGKADLVWEHTDGTTVAYLMDALSVSSAAVIAGANGAAFSVKGIGDLNGDSRGDIVWQFSNGQAGAWLMNGATISGGGMIGGINGSSVEVRDVADLNGDGLMDLVWQDTINGQAIGFLMNGITITSAATIGAANGADWLIV